MNLKFTLLGLLIITGLMASAQTPSIVTQVSPAAICPGDTMFITFTTSDTFAADNVFTILLSDSTGSFAAADTLDTIQAQSGSTIAMAAPAIPGSMHYKITVISSDPAVIGVAGAVYIRTLLAPPNTHLSYSTADLCTGDSIKLSIDSLPNVVYTWFYKDTARVDSNKYFYTAKKPGEYGILFTDTSKAGCSVGFDSVSITLHTYPAKPTIGVGGNGHPNICGTGTVALIVTHQDTAVVGYQWTDHGNNIAGASNNTYSAAVSGVYSLVITTIYGCSVKATDSISVNIASVPTVSLQLPTSSFCLYGPAPSLDGGSPTGGYFSGSYVNGNQFIQTSSGLGTFTVYYTFVDTIGCHGTDSATLTILNCTTGITQNSSEPAISLYPNPTTDRVTITAAQPGTINLRVANMAGQEISNQLFENQIQYSVANLPAGVYLLEMTGQTDNWKLVKKLVVE